MNKQTLVFAGLLLCAVANAQTADQLKKSSMDSCNLQASTIPEAQREMVLNICKCGVENTDYEMMLSTQNDPQKMQELQAKAMKVAQECATKTTS